MIVARSNVGVVSYEEDTVGGIVHYVALFNTHFISEKEVVRCLESGEGNTHIVTMTQQAFDEIFYKLDETFYT